MCVSFSVFICKLMGMCEDKTMSLHSLQRRRCGEKSLSFFVEVHAHTISFLPPPVFLFSFSFSFFCFFRQRQPSPNALFYSFVRAQIKPWYCGLFFCFSLILFSLSLPAILRLLDKHFFVLSVCDSRSWVVLAPCEPSSPSCLSTYVHVPLAIKHLPVSFLLSCSPRSQTWVGYQPN